MKETASVATMLIVVIVLSSVAFAQAPSSVTLTIDVSRRAYKQVKPQPFPGVGLFELHRGGKRMENSSCPDNSNDKGVVFCAIVCKESDVAAAPIMVHPPSGKDALAGWVVPSRQTVTLKGCTLTPRRLVALYEDARYALNRYIREAQLVAVPPQADTPVWDMNIVANVSVLNQLHEWAKSPKGRQQVLEMVEASAAASGSVEYTSGKLSAEEAKELEALIVWQVAAKNALLKAKADRTLGGQHISYDVKITGLQDEYLANLKSLERTLERHTPPTPETMKFGDDVKTLRSLKSVGWDASKSVGVIRGWK